MSSSASPPNSPPDNNGSLHPPKPGASEPKVAPGVHLARVRENQRRSRARRKTYLTELETRFRQCEQTGVAASAEMQAAARQVLEENRQLRAFLRAQGFDDAQLDAHAAKAHEAADPTNAAQAFVPPSPAAANLESLFAKRTPCGPTAPTVSSTNENSNVGRVAISPARTLADCSSIPGCCSPSPAKPKTISPPVGPQRIKQEPMQLTRMPMPPAATHAMQRQPLPAAVTPFQYQATSIPPANHNPSHQHQQQQQSYTTPVWPPTSHPNFAPAVNSSAGIPTTSGRLDLLTAVPAQPSGNPEYMEWPDSSLFSEHNALEDLLPYSEMLENGDEPYSMH